MRWTHCRTYNKTIRYTTKERRLYQLRSIEVMSYFATQVGHGFILRGSIIGGWSFRKPSSFCLLYRYSEYIYILCMIYIYWYSGIFPTAVVVGVSDVKEFHLNRNLNVKMYIYTFNVFIIYSCVTRMFWAPRKLQTQIEHMQYPSLWRISILYACSYN
jgi:hypothetical protein